MNETADTCPRGHKLLTLFGGRKCLARRCAEQAREEALAAPPPKRAASLTPAERGEVGEGEKAFSRRAKLSQLPVGLKGEEATKWAQDKLVALLPEAVASVAYDLRYGTDRERSAAADRVLAASGLDKREAAKTGGQGLIVLNINTGGESIPWLQRMYTKPVDGDK